MIRKLALGSYRFLYSYSTSHLKGSRKVLFFYALKGRGNKPGVLEKTKSKFLAKGVLLVRPEYEETIDAFFKSWACPFEKWRIRAPSPSTQVRALKSLKEVEDVRLVESQYICVVSKKSKKLLVQLRNILGSEKITLKTSRELFEDQPLLELFSREQSLLKETPITHTLFLYSASHLSQTEKVKFFYALKGRDGAPGALQQTASKFLAKTVVLTPITKAKAMQQFLTKWKCRISKLEVSLESKR